MKMRLAAALSLLLLCAQTLAFDLNAELAKAKPGDVVVLPAEVVRGTAKVPAGVTLRGAGYDKTTLEGNLVLKDAHGARVENLTVLNKGTAISITSSKGACVSRVLVSGGTIGIQASALSGVSVENCVVSGALIGISGSELSDSAIVNCTIFNADACGLSISGSTGCAVFNNVVVNAGTGIVVGGKNDKLAIDHNLYVALSTGKIEGQLQRPSLPTWRDVSGGLDAHSVQLPVTFANPSKRDFHPVSTLTWNPSRITTADWGTLELAGHRAPTTDMDGQPRGSAALHAGLGAFEAPDLPSRKPDGQFKVESDEGVKSAGLFTASGTAVAYLFQSLPLRKGKHNFVLPARDMFGRSIEPGKYEVRVVESCADWIFSGMTSNSGPGTTPEEADSVHVTRVLFMPDGMLATASGWSERHINARLGDPATGKAKWTFEGSADNAGLCLDSEGKILLMRNGAEKSFDLYRIDPATGIPLVVPASVPAGRDAGPTAYFTNIKGKFKSQYLGGIAELGGKLFVADPDTGKVFMDGMDSLKFETSIDLPKPVSPSADRKRNLVWLISNQEKIVAISTDGKVAHTFAEVKMPLALAVAGDRLAVASAETGKIHIFDITAGDKLTPVKTLGRGDGPFGPWLPDRFHFQSHALNRNYAHVAISLHENGSIALRDSSARVVVFGPDGKCIHDGFAVWGGDPVLVRFADGKLRGFDSNGAASYVLDASGGKWHPDTYWGLPAMTSPNPRGWFSASGHNFGVFTCQNPEKKGEEWVLIASYDNPVVKPVALYKRKAGGGYLLCKDTNGDGVIDDKDQPGEVVLCADGKPLNVSLTGRFTFVQPDGTIIHSEQKLALMWKLKSVDDKGGPNYEFNVLAAKDPLVPSPYFHDQTEDLRCTSAAKMTSDGGIFSGINLRHTPNGMGLSNSGATDLARWNPDGTLRWLRTTNDYSPIQGVEPFPGVLVSSWGHQAEYFALDDDGLELGRFGFPAAVNWSGFWVDHPQEWSAVRTDDGNIQIIIGDYMQNCHHWMTLRKLDTVRKTKVEVSINAEKSRELTYRPVMLHEKLAAAKAPEIIIKKLGGPMNIDGNPQKWRAFPPQILLTPQNSFGRIDGPKDLSGVLRLAYHGRDLYGQVIVFDDVVSFHQPASRFYQGDSLQFCINGFLTGFGFSITQTVDKGAFFLRNRFFFQKMDLDLDPAKAPRVIKKFENAEDIPERQLIESIYGVDLAQSPGYIIEFKLPLDESTYKDDEKIIPPVESGKSFWLGFMLNDNDTPGTDVQNFIAWPGTFGMFNPAEAGAKAIFE
ncbi:MAG TPA: right-handed parallel beta-helix repeat-containing protein [Planctomycetota bacterium]|jgi:hypothetical protein